MSDAIYATVLPNPGADPRAPGIATRLPPSYSSIFNDSSVANVIRNDAAFAREAMPAPRSRGEVQETNSLAFRDVHGRKYRRRDTPPPSTENAPLSLYGPDHLSSKGYVVRDSSRDRLSRLSGAAAEPEHRAAGASRVRGPGKYERSRSMTGAATERSALAPYRHAVYTQGTAFTRSTSTPARDTAHDYDEDCLSYCSRAYNPQRRPTADAVIPPNIPISEWPYCEYFARYRYRELVAIAQQAHAYAARMQGASPDLVPQIHASPSPPVLSRSNSGTQTPPRTYPEPSAPPCGQQMNYSPATQSIAVQVSDSMPPSLEAASGSEQWC